MKQTETFFQYSQPQYGLSIRNTHEKIINSAEHPLFVFAKELNKPTNKDFPPEIEGTSQSNYLQPFILPEPLDLLNICLYLEIHPADLIPLDPISLAPMPRSVVKLCKDISANNKFYEADREAAYELIESEIAAIERFKNENSALWAFLENIKVTVDRCDKDKDKYTFTFQSKELQRVFDRAATESSIEDLAIYPAAPDASFCRTARNWDESALESIDALTVKPAQEKRKAALEFLKEIATQRGFSSTTMKHYKETISALLSHQDETMPTGLEADRQWTQACWTFHHADKEAYETDEDLNDKITEFIDTYKMERFGKHTIEEAFGFFENSVIINSDDHTTLLYPNYELPVR